MSRLFQPAPLQTLPSVLLPWAVIKILSSDYKMAVGLRGKQTHHYTNQHRRQIFGKIPHSRNGGCIVAVIALVVLAGYLIGVKVVQEAAALVNGLPEMWETAHTSTLQS